MKRHRIPRAKQVNAATWCRVEPNRSMSGPTRGASTRNGASVSARYTMTRGRAAPTETLKNSDPASDTAKNALAPALHACV